MILKKIVRLDWIAIAIICGVGIACHLRSQPPIAEDTFGEVLSGYSHYSDGGYPWALASNSLQGNGFGLQSILIRKSVFIRDGWVETVIDSADDGGLVLRFSDNQNYYLLAIRDDRAPYPRNVDNLQLYRRAGEGQGGFVSLWRADVTWPRGVPHRVRFAASGDNLSVYFDERRIVSISDTQDLAGRGIGVRHYGNAARWITRYRRLSWGNSR